MNRSHLISSNHHRPFSCLSQGYHYRTVTRTTRDKDGRTCWEGQIPHHQCRTIEEVMAGSPGFISRAISCSETNTFMCTKQLFNSKTQKSEEACWLLSNSQLNSLRCIDRSHPWAQLLHPQTAHRAVIDGRMAEHRPTPSGSG